MDDTGYLASLRQALTHSAATEAPHVQEAAERIALALEPAVRLLLIEMASDIAAEVTAELDGDIVEIRMRGGAPELVVTPQPTGDDAQEAMPRPDADASGPHEAEGATARLSLRMPGPLKEQVDTAATTAGLSANAWIIRTLSQALHSSASSKSRHGRQLSGWMR